MLSIILNIVGLLCIVISLIIINNISKEEKELYEEILLIHEDVKYCSSAMENIFSSFDDLIETSLNNLETYQKKHLTIMDKEYVERDNYSSDNNLDQNEKNILDDSKEDNISNKEINRRIFQLKEQGLSNEQIAKKLNKGIREVDIIIKMWSSIN